MTICVVGVSVGAGLAKAASAPGKAATAAATAAPATSAASAAAAASAASAAAATAGFLHHAADRSGILLIEGVECRQTDVGEFFDTEREFVTRCNIRRLRNVRYRRDGCGCSAHQRKSQTSGPQYRDGFRRSLSLRSLLHSWHSPYPPCIEKRCFESSQRILRRRNPPCKMRWRMIWLSP
jgi:hypothetical protein